MLQSRELAVVFDDHTLFAHSFASFLQKNGSFHTVSVFTKQDELWSFLMANRNKPIFLFSDYYLATHNSLQLLADIKRILVHLKIIMVSSISNAVELRRIMFIQPNGIVNKASDFINIFDCIDAVFAGKQYLCPFTTKVLAESNKEEQAIFTKREIDMLQYFNQGLTLKETADATKLSTHTVIAHRRNMMHKIRVNTITELLAHARKLQLID